MGRTWGADDPADGEALQQALVALTALTGLRLASNVAAVPNPAAALEACSQLQWVCDTCDPPRFGADAWPQQLRCARLTWRQLLQAPWPAGFAPYLRYLRIGGHPYLDGVNWSQVKGQPEWAAFWDWAATAHDLRMLEVRSGVKGDRLPHEAPAGGECSISSVFRLMAAANDQLPEEELETPCTHTGG